MPIKAENKSLYPPDWKAISKRIRFERAGNKCEQCSAPNGVHIFRWENEPWYTLENGDTFHKKTGERVGRVRGSEMGAGKFVKIVLTVAHLNHDPTDNSEENLKALCQRCHLAYDAEHHKANAAKTRHNKKACADMFLDTPKPQGEEE